MPAPEGGGSSRRPNYHGSFTPSVVSQDAFASEGRDVDTETVNAERREARRPCEGERRLMLEMIEQAIRDGRVRKAGSRTYTRRAQEGARAWLRLDDEVMDRPFSARYCMEANGINYAAMMERIEAAWKTGENFSLTRRVTVGYRKHVVLNDHGRKTP